MQRTGRGLVTRRGFLALGAAAGAIGLAACAGGEDATSSDGATRAVDHPLGRTEVPQRPQRVVVLNDTLQEDLAALGAPVVAGVTANVTGEIPDFVRTRLPPDFVEMGRLSDVTAERVLGQAPDMIVGSDIALEDDYPQFAQVAPTIAVPLRELGQPNWAQRLEFTAAALGTPEAARPVLDAYRGRVATLAARLPQPRPTVSIARVFSDEFEYRTLEGSFPWSVLRDLGFRPPPQQEPGDLRTPQVELSLEQARLLEADVIIVSVDGGGEAGTTGAAQLAQLEQSGLFSGVRGRRVTVNSNEFVFGGPLTANRILDLVESSLVA